MSRVARKVKDKRVLKLIRAYLKAGIMVEGICVRSEEGTPQGGPLSPLLANILLDDLDKELERRQLRFRLLTNTLFSTEQIAQRCVATAILKEKINLDRSSHLTSIARWPIFSDSWQQK